MKRHLSLFLFALVAVLPLAAQDRIMGVMLDSLTHRPIVKANVMLLRGGKTLTFARTNDKGQFSFAKPAAPLTELELQATAMGYGKKRIKVKALTNNTIELSEKAFEMKEITVKAGPITGRKDTITFDLTRFANERDNSLKDVLKKLPGVNVAKDGEISVNGKKISRFTVEGLDLSDGRYNKLTENVKAKDVKKAEVIEHDQPVKALRDKVFTDNVAMNVVLKDSARDQLSVTLRPYFATNSPTHVAGAATAMQIGKRRQKMYDVVYNRIGDDVASLSSRFVLDFMSPQPASLPTWYSVPSLQAPISEDRLRFNTSQSYMISHLMKSKSDAETRISADYYRNVLRQHTKNTSLYYLKQVPTEVSEDQFYTLKEDRLNLSIDRKINEDTRYGSMRFAINAAQGDGLSMLQSTGHDNTAQRVRNPELNIKALITQTHTLERGTLSWQSIVDYHHSRNDLYLDADHEKLSNNLYHTDNEATYRTTSNYFTRTYNLGIKATHLNVRRGDTELTFYSSPRFNYRRGKWQLNFTQGLRLKHLAHEQKWLFHASPSLYASYKKSSKTETTASLSYASTSNGVETFALDSYRTNYRTFHVSPSFVPTSRSLNFSFTHSYKRVIREFFAKFNLTANRSWGNSVVDMQIQNGNYLMSYLQHNTKNSSTFGSVWLSKGFSTIHLKTSCNLYAAWSEGEQYTAGRVVGFRYRSLSVEPSLFFSPSWMQISYDGSFSLSKSQSDNADMKSRFNWKQVLSLTSTIRKIDLTLSGIYYHNQLETHSLNTFLADAMAVWRLKNVRFTAKVRNLFDKRSYVVTNYSGVGIFTNHYELRPREFVLSCEFGL
ncbi:carboxypeptidase-like regulatory domain-containing protein [Prevotella ihumii]|uniref:carboxypeptidase-like regulatory domain-containing protein n=1 Tax=Prevotella ihumii TaxID=1917878 RepID=UPI001F1A31E6|nr:carboxypeptidase-like regulatory domain-containing protein [Prevotella ihumii]